MKKSKRKKTSRSTGAVDKFIGARTRDCRRSLGLSQADLAVKLGITHQQVLKYEIGVNRVSAARLFDICEVLGVSLASMFDRKLDG